MMMSREGRGSAAAGKGLIMVAVVYFLLIHSNQVHGTTYTVGGSGWTFNTVNWPKGKSFRAGDVLAFNYDPTSHNVVAVNKGGYGSCTTPTGAKVYQNGNDKIKLVKGQNYFICNYPGHCESGMKIAVNAL